MARERLVQINANGTSKPLPHHNFVSQRAADERFFATLFR